jgi:hypothetical protein
MFEHIEYLDAAVEYFLEKSTTNNKAHIRAAQMSQDDYDKHADALAHHASGIMHYREKPSVKKFLEAAGSLIPHRQYINAPIKLDQKKQPSLEMHDLNHEHPAIKGRDEASKQQLLSHLNNSLAALHREFHSNSDVKALHEHSQRFLAHIASMAEWNNLQKAGKGAHHNFVGEISGPELTGRPSNSRFRGHSPLDSSQPNTLTAQSVSKGSGSAWHPGFPEFTALEENSRHPSIGKPKELYPFHEITVNKQPLKLKKFDSNPEHIHDADYATNLSRQHKVKTPDGEITRAIGVHSGAKTADQIVEGMQRVGALKKSYEFNISQYFPDATFAHFTLAKNLMDVVNPYAGMSDEAFSNYLNLNLMKSLRASEQAAILAEAVNRFEKAEKPKSEPLSQHALHQQGVEDVMSGKLTPLVLQTAGARTKKEDEKRNEVQDLPRGTKKAGAKRSPFAVPAHVFTDDTYTKVDPKKYHEYVHAPLTEQDHRNELATYQHTIRTNPQAQTAHRAYKDAMRESSQEAIRTLSGITRGEEEKPEAPVNEHHQTLEEAGKALAARKITAQEFARINAQASAKRAKGVTHKATDEELTPQEKDVRAIDPDYRPTRESQKRKADTQSMKDLTSIAQGNTPKRVQSQLDQAQEVKESSRLDDGNQEDQFTNEEYNDEESAAEEKAKEESEAFKGYSQSENEASTKDFASGKGSSEESGEKQSASPMKFPTPQEFLDEHPGFKSYLMLKDHLLSHYTDPAVRDYMEQKINSHENSEKPNAERMAALFHFLHRSSAQAKRAAGGANKLMGDIAKDWNNPAQAEPDPSAGRAGAGKALAPETMLSPDQREKLNAARRERDKATPPVASTAANESAAAPVEENKPKTKLRRSK